jgi:hypothetical protein
MLWGDSSGKKALRLCESLIETCEKNQRRINGLELEFEALYDKCRSALQRVSKRAEAVERAEQQQPAPAPADDTELHGAVVANDGVVGGPLTARQKAIQQQILKRRMGGIQ